MIYKKVVPGLVIELPSDKKHHGVILDSTRMKNGWFKVTILTYSGDCATCRLKLREDGEHLWFRNYHLYDTESIMERMI